ncbi:DUF6480 family protein [Gordonia sp. SL306]|uniref:DUF6480 family protein n=1 Tax=Gordonia sp. SL306 TaxID=2995145 RepID=UPI00227110E4|nr:DUF6480 family protein [Gordonia sp. SL306]WAC55558.1 DUF6480 family protein [Gordonia sp. SL306]
MWSIASWVAGYLRSPQSGVRQIRGDLLSDHIPEHDPPADPDPDPQTTPDLDSGVGVPSGATPPHTPQTFGLVASAASAEPAVPAAVSVRSSESS